MSRHGDFVVGEELIEAGPGQIIIAPPGTPHKFTNAGSQIAYHTDIQTANRMGTTRREP